MRNTMARLSILILWAGPLMLGTARAQQDAPPAPDKNGVYPAVPPIEAPYLVSPALAAWPQDANTATPPRIVRLTAVIGVDGAVQSLNVMQPQADPFEDAATAAVKQSKFAPGTLNGAAVPVLVCVRVPFIRMRPALPRLRDCPDPGADAFGNAANTTRLPPGASPPRVLAQANPEYSDQARKKRIQGIVLIALTVNEQGQPTDVHVVRSLGYGLDENALDCVSRYRFQPAVTREGTPFPYRLTVEISYRLY
ncbi:MAG TPA: energy transducer TonB [Acidobacteriaceae bacterium]|jgi:TonB family protein|nr:energy transducer TonB [Acidobacteriaceae bacterium]